jgi:2,4-dienoyl-CoA reductase (NADPH2)
MTACPHLLAPLRVGPLTLPNRTVMGAMHTRLETLDRPLERLAAFYAARAVGGTGLILTGGFAPCPEGAMEPDAPVFDRPEQLAEHRPIVEAVHRAGGRILLQILHAGRYARLPGCVAPSEGRARINRFAPRALSSDEVAQTVAAFGRTAALAREAGYDGVEVMGSEGYLLNEFTCAATNRREDAYGGGFEARLRFPLEVIAAVRASLGSDRVLAYRLSALDLVPGGMTGQETAEFARRVQAAGADLINTGIGWHEAAVPTIAAAVPRAAWLAAVRNVKRAVSIPVMASNRINTPEVAEALLAEGDADLVSLARPLLADPAFVRKAAAGRSAEIAPCIACNQACLDHIFTGRTATCLVNPVAGRELDLADRLAAPADPPRRIAVVGGGAAGLAFATAAAARGHRITLFEAGERLGGQLLLAQRVPGKAEFTGLLSHWEALLARQRVEVRLNHRVETSELGAEHFDEVVLASGVRPRRPDLPGVDHPRVLSYADVLSGAVTPGERVAILGAGGIGFDVAAFLTGDSEEALDAPTFWRRWGIDASLAQPGGLLAEGAGAAAPAPRRQVTLLQRSPGTLGRTLGRTTGWILKAQLERAGVAMIGGAQYERIEDAGTGLRLHLRVDDQPHVLSVDHIVLCTGQESQHELLAALTAAGHETHRIGGAASADGLDAQRAIEQATRLAAAL